MSDETQLGLVVGIGGIIVAVVGVLVSVYYARRALKAERALRKLSWPDIQNAAQEMGSQIQAQFCPDLIVTPGLTGATFANLLADEFNWQPPVIVGTRTWKGSKYELIADEDADVIETNKWIVTIPNKAYKTTGNVLIVDDFAMSGDFIDRLSKQFAANSPDARVMSATIATTKVALENHKAPDFYWKVALDADFYFPWGKAK